MNKNLPKLVKHIFPTNKQWTRVWFAGYRSLHLPFVGVDGDIADLVKTKCTIMLDLCSLQERLTKVPPLMSIFWEFAKRPKPES